MTTTGAIDNNTLISRLESMGLQTTALYSDAETNFVQYGQALSQELQEEIVGSFDNEQDYIIQQQIAELFQSTNVIDSGSFISACQSLGLSCSVDYESTSYIVDYKQSQSGAVVDGYIAVYTISDGKGGEIKIADANGNGYLETEEIFMNEILSGINNEISTAGTGAIQAADGATNQGPSQEEFNQKVEEYLRLGYTVEEATIQVNTYFNTTNGTYTGAYTSVSQNEFNKAVEEYLNDGDSRELSIIKAKNILMAKGALNLDLLTYTGNVQEKDPEEENVEVKDEEESEAPEAKPSISLVITDDEKDKEKAA